MKTRTHLRCRLARWADKPSNAVTRHIAVCPDCQQYFAAANALSSELRADASRRSVVAPDDMASRVLQSLAREPVVRPRSRSWPILLAGSGLGIAAALTVVLLQPPRGMAPNSSAATTTLAAIADQLPSWERLSAPVVTALDAEPLQNETDRVVADARSALRFLALNFLPDSAAQSGGAETRTQQRADG